MTPCTKRGYRTRAEALGKVGVALKNRRRYHKPRAYRCPECGLFHLTRAVARESTFRKRSKVREAEAVEDADEGGVL